MPDFWVLGSVKDSTSGPSEGGLRVLNSDSEICRLSSKVTICKDSVFCISEKGHLVYHGTYQECTDFLDRLENNTARGTRMPRLSQSKLLKLFRRLIGLGSWRRQEVSGTNSTVVADVSAQCGL